jgi:uncharacterized protein (TIGR02599 family)
VGKGFTLLEMMISLVLLLMIIGVVFRVTDAVMTMNRRISAGVSIFQNASAALEHVSARISEATLNTYWDYYPPQIGDHPKPPENYIRMSDLHFVADDSEKLEIGSQDTYPTKAIFFQAPLGYSRTEENDKVTDLLNVCGFYVAFGNDEASIPPIPALRKNAKWRYRLMELVQPTEDLTVYSITGGSADAGQLNKSHSWFLDPIKAGTYARPLAENIIAFIVQPKIADVEEASSQSLSTDYHYDSREGTISEKRNPPQPITQNQLPPVLRITMVAIDERSAARLADEFGDQQPQLVDPSFFKNTVDYDKDIERLEHSLTEKRITYRAFSMDVPIRSAKWSTR